MWNKEINLTPRKRRFPGPSKNVKRKILLQLSITVFFLLIIYIYLLPDTQPHFARAENNNQSFFLYQSNWDKKDITAKETVLVTTTDYSFVPTTVVGEENYMFYTRGGSGYPYIFVTSDENKESNSVKIWKHNFEIFNQLGTFFAVDMINYGNSNPGPKTKKRHILEEEHAKLYSYFVIDQLNIPEKRIVMMARGKSASLTIKAASQIESRVAGIVLIAPWVNKELLWDIRNIPILLVWGKDDPIVPFEKSMEILSICNNVTPLFFDRIVQPGINNDLAHQPDMMRNAEFYNGVKDWMLNLKTR